MTATICPTITAATPDEYRRQMERVARFATRVHIDLSDGKFASAKMVAPDEVWWPGGVRADIHMMYRRPFEHTKLLLNLHPQLIIVHAEAEGDFVGFAEAAHAQGVEVGVALLPQTSPELIRPALKWIDYVLIFSGNLGHFGGQADMRLLTKLKHVRELKPTLEIGWDGGINDQNARALSMAGVDVLNTGGFIHHASNPREAYDRLEKIVHSSSPMRGVSPDLLR
jgi:ribulose-phosphate 3-epimerase